MFKKLSLVFLLLLGLFCLFDELLGFNDIFFLELLRSRCTLRWAWWVKTGWVLWGTIWWFWAITEILLIHISIISLGTHNICPLIEINFFIKACRELILWRILFRMLGSLMFSTFVLSSISGLLPHCLLTFVVMVFGIWEKCCCLRHIVRHMATYQITTVNFITIIINDNLTVDEICTQSRQVV